MQVFQVTVYGINSSGQIAGTINIVNAGGTTAKDIAVTWKGTEVVVLGDLASLGSTVARTSDPINDRGDVIGSQAGPDNIGRAVLWRDGKTISLAPGLRDATGTAINNNGDVVGTGTGAWGSRGFRWQNGQTVELPPVTILTLSLSRTVWVTGINNAGLIVGWTTALNVEGSPTQGAVNRATTWTIY
jgi:probable HAF family extracellular repeat protein